jgi:flavin-dependent dehydrogenase
MGCSCRVSSISSHFPVSILSRPIRPIPRSVFTITPSYAAVPVGLMPSIPFGNVVYLAGDSALSPNFVTYSGLNTGLKSAEFIAQKLFYQTIDELETIHDYQRLIGDLTKIVSVPPLFDRSK